MDEENKLKAENKTLKHLVKRYKAMYERVENSARFWERKYIEERDKHNDYLFNEGLKKLTVDEDGKLV